MARASAEAGKFAWYMAQIWTSPIMYPANLAKASSPSIMYPANFLGLGRGLDFLLVLFLHQGKKRRIG